jgi:hypothetical protein
MVLSGPKRDLIGLCENGSFNFLLFRDQYLRQVGQNMIRKLIRILLLLTMLCFCNLSNASEINNIEGKWRGILKEKSGSILVGLEIGRNRNTIQGTFTILSETKEEIEKGMVFQIIKIQHSNNTLKFMVPVFNEQVNDDAIAFELMMEENQLRGYAHELRKGSDRIPIIFTRDQATGETSNPSLANDIAEDIDNNIRKLRDKDPLIRRHAATALSRSADPRIVEPLINTLKKDKDAEVRQIAALALAKGLGNHYGIDAVADIARHGDKGLRVLLGIGQVGLVKPDRRYFPRGCNFLSVNSI